MCFEEGDIAGLSEKGHGGYLKLDRVSEERTSIKGTRTTSSGLLQGKVTQKILMKVPWRKTQIEASRGSEHGSFLTTREAT